MKTVIYSFLLGIILGTFYTHQDSLLNGKVNQVFTIQTNPNPKNLHEQLSKANFDYQVTLIKAQDNSSKNEKAELIVGTLTAEELAAEPENKQEVEESVLIISEFEEQSSAPIAQSQPLQIQQQSTVEQKDALDDIATSSTNAVNPQNQSTASSTPTIAQPIITNEVAVVTKPEIKLRPRVIDSAKQQEQLRKVEEELISKVPEKTNNQRLQILEVRTLDNNLQQNSQETEPTIINLSEEEQSTTTQQNQISQPSTVSTIQTNSRNPYLMLAASYRLIKQQEYDQALERLLKARHIIPESLNVLENIAVVYNAKNQPQKALEFYLQAADVAAKQNDKARFEFFVERIAIIDEQTAQALQLQYSNLTN